MHLFVALETSTLRRMSLVQYSSCCRVSPKLGIPGLLDAIGLDAVEELVAIKEDRFIAADRDLDTSSFFFFLILYPLRHCGGAYQAEILGAASGRRFVHSSRVKFPLVNMSAS